MGWYGLDLLETTPHFNKNSFMLPDKNEEVLLECTNCGIPHKLKSFSRQLIKVEEYMLDYGKANENLEHLSIITSKYLLRDELDRGPLKSILIHLNGFDALMR